MTSFEPLDPGTPQASATIRAAFLLLTSPMLSRPWWQAPQGSASFPTGSHCPAPQALGPAVLEQEGREGLQPAPWGTDLTLNLGFPGSGP